MRFNLNVDCKKITHFLKKKKVETHWKLKKKRYLILYKMCWLVVSHDKALSVQ